MLDFAKTPERSEFILRQPPRASRWPAGAGVGHFIEANVNSARLFGIHAAVLGVDFSEVIEFCGRTHFDKGVFFTFGGSSAPSHLCAILGNQNDVRLATVSVLRDMLTFNISCTNDLSESNAKSFPGRRPDLRPAHFFPVSGGGRRTPSMMRMSTFPSLTVTILGTSRGSYCSGNLNPSRSTSQYTRAPLHQAPPALGIHNQSQSCRPAFRDTPAALHTPC